MEEYLAYVIARHKHTIATHVGVGQIWTVNVAKLLLQDRVLT